MAARPTVLFDLGLGLGLFLSFCSLPSQCSAVETEGVIINEIAWMGNEKSANDEWIELYNGANYGINLNGWTLRAGDSFQANLKGTIPAKGFYLLERSDDKTLPNISADMIFKGSLNNKGQKIGLYNQAGKLIDEVDCSQGWFGGDNTSKQTMERVNSGEDGSSAKNWQTSTFSGGTPKARNSLAVSKNQKQEQIESAYSADLSADTNGAEDSQTIGLKTKFVVFILAIFNGIIIIFLKRSLNQINN